jgi:hypothetical protein
MFIFPVKYLAKNHKPNLKLASGITQKKSPKQRHQLHPAIPRKKLKSNHQTILSIAPTSYHSISATKMSTRNRTPPLLEPYLRLPSEGSQLLLTGVLDSSPNWLVTRLLRSAFTSSAETESPEEQDVTVVLVSWLRDYDFWKSETRRGAVSALPVPKGNEKRERTNTDM